MKSIIQNLFSNWHFMRWVQLLVGIYMLIHGIQKHDILSYFFSALFLFQAITNTGCCGARNCSVNSDPKQKVDAPVEYEEVK